MRRVFSIKARQYPQLKKHLLSLSKEHSHFQFFDSNSYQNKFSQYDWLMAYGKQSSICPAHNEFDELYQFHSNHKDWLFGHISYDLKNSLEKLESKNPDPLEFSKLEFFIPKTVVYAKGEEIFIESLEFQNQKEFLYSLNLKAEDRGKENEKVLLLARTSKSEYISTLTELKKELQYGNIYEINYCIEFANHGLIDPVNVFSQLQNISPAPFSSFYKIEDQFLICSSPERYLQKKENTIISQPIKGTSKRSSNEKEDNTLKQELQNNEKERAENVMIVDLVRNDLSRTALRKSVKVNELFGIYSYPNVHQMTSTISSEIDPEKTAFTDVLKYSFPMGSMTGAPKIKAMQLIEEYENFSRSLYSGAVGYIDPNGNFDFNVVIRSILYNSKSNYISARVGSAITILSDPEKEYEECLLKAQKLFEALA